MRVLLLIAFICAAWGHSNLALGQQLGDFFTYLNASPTVNQYDGGTGQLVNSYNLSSSLGSDFRFSSIDAAGDGRSIRLYGENKVVSFNTSTGTVSSVVEASDGFRAVVVSPFTGVIFGFVNDDLASFDPSSNTVNLAGLSNSIVFSRERIKFGPNGRFFVHEQVLSQPGPSLASYEENFNSFGGGGAEFAGPLAFSEDSIFALRNDGDLFVASFEDGTSQTMSLPSAITATSVVDMELGRDGDLFFKNRTDIYRYDLTTGASELFLASDNRNGFFTFQTSLALLIGDVNRDGTVDFLDIDPFITLLSSGGFQEEADMDQNGDVNFLDIAPFVTELSN